MQNDSPGVIDAFDFAEVIFRNKYKILLFPLAVLSAAAAVILFAPRTYESEAKIFLRLGRESVGIDPTATTGQTVSVQQMGRESDVQSAIDLMLSRGMADKVVERVGAEYVLRGGPEGSEPDNPVLQLLMKPVKGAIGVVKGIDKVSRREEALIEMGKKLRVDAERDSTVIVVSYEADSAEGAQHILHNLIELYQEEYQRLHRYPESQSFFAEQRDLLQDAVLNASHRLRDAKNRMGLASVDGRRTSYEAQISNIELASYTAEQELTAAQARIQDLREQLQQMPERQLASKTSKPNEGADLLRDQLYELQVRQLELKSRYSDEHPLVRAVSAQLKQAKQVVDEQQDRREETVDDINPIHRDLTLELKRQESLAAAHSARLGTLDEQKSLAMSDMRQLNKDEVQIASLERELGLAEAKLMKYSDNYEQARIDQALQDDHISSVSVPQPATLQEKPVSPSKVLIGLAGIAMAIGGTASWVLVSEKLNNKIRSEADAQRALGVPVYAAIPNQAIHARVLAN